MLRPGEPWGSLGVLEPSAPVFSNDRDLATFIQPFVMNDASNRATPVVGLAGGDLCATLGGRGDVADRLGCKTMLLPVDVGLAVVDGQAQHAFVAHVLWRARFWRGPAVAAMNADLLGAWRPAPRAHPGDGKLDVVQGQLGLRERLIARKRARTGDHVPHPDIAIARTTQTSITLRRRPLWIDGTNVGSCARLELSLAPQAVLVAV